MIYSLLFVAYLLPVTTAYTTFDTNCTLPSASEKINYISSPNTRGTLDILWSCLFTIVSCTWTVQYPDLPTRRGEFAAGRIGAWKWAAKKYYGLAKWFLMTLVAPELLLGVYIGQNTRMRQYVKEFEEAGWAKIDKVEWTKSHICLAEMSGFVAEIRKHKPDSSDRSTQTGTEGTTTDDPDDISQDLSPGTASRQSDEVRSHQDSLTASEEGNATQEEPEFTVSILDCGRILALRKAGILTRLPDISTEEIEDRSKADGFVRLITVFQIIWLCVQTIARAVEGLAVTQLEIATVAFSACAVSMYILCWDKPKGVQVPITIFRYYGDKERIIDEIKKADKKTPSSDSSNYIERTTTFSSDTFAGLMTFMLGGTIFGGIHLIAWNFVFPTHAELILWRVSALFCTGFLPAAVLILIAGISYETAVRRKGATLSETRQTALDWIAGIFLLVVPAGIYVLVRLFIIVEMFRTLAFQPREAYVGTWTVNIPFVS